MLSNHVTQVMFNHQILIAMEIPLHFNYTSSEAAAWPSWGLCYCQIAVWGSVFFFLFSGKAKTVHVSLGRDEQHEYDGWTGLTPARRVETRISRFEDRQLGIGW